jgi:hypothetical protein
LSIVGRFKWLINRDNVCKRQQFTMKNKKLQLCQLKFNRKC